jgi:hypothetical protein
MHKPKNRGKDSGDDKLFGRGRIQLKLKAAVDDLSYLMGKGYAQRSATALVGNRYRLNLRQQKAVMGMSASDLQVESRQKNSLPVSAISGKELVVDGFNVLILLESFLSNAYIFKGRDGFFRDLSGVHGSYKKVQQTDGAIGIMAGFHLSANVLSMHWFFDKPVSNSGKLKQLVESIALEKGLRWKVSLTYTTDKDIVKENKTVLSSDAWILDNAPANFNLAGHLLKDSHSSNIIDLYGI